MRGCHAALTQRADASGGRRVAGVSWPGGQASPPTSQSVARAAPVDRSEATRSKRTRALVLRGHAGGHEPGRMTAVAQAQASDPDGKGARRLATERQAAETERERPVTAQQQAAADAALQRVLARERFSIPSQTPDQPTAPVPPEPSGQPNWLLASLGGFAAGLALAGGLAVFAARRAGRSARVGHAA